MASKALLAPTLVLTLLVVLVRHSQGYGRGAPDSACLDMLPQHGPNPQTSASPYSVTTSQTLVEPGGKLIVKISSNSPDRSFRGFMIRGVSGTPEVPVGTFLNPPDRVNPLTCKQGFHNTLTHGNGRNKTSLEFTWQAPNDFQGDVLFRCTFVKDYSTYWVSVPASSPVRVARSAGTGSDSPFPTTYSGHVSPGNSASAYAYASTPSYGPPPSTTTYATTTVAKAGLGELQTSSWSFSTPAPSSSPQHLLPAVYAGCGDLKGCFGLYDAACLEHGTCSALVTYALKGTRYEFELWAPDVRQNSYVAVGFSTDDHMGDDSVTECTLVNGRVNVFMSYNDGKRNTRLRDATSGLSGVEARFSDGQLYCRFTRQSPMTVNGHTFDLSTPDGLYLLLVRGPASENAIEFHAGQRAASARPVRLAETSSVGARKGTLIKLHGAFMTAAWLFSASLGILFARYFRLTWVGRQLMGKDLWFVFHRILMVLTWALTLVAVVLIFVELDGWTSVPISTNPHSLIGMIVTVLAFIQPIMAYFRPHPGTPRRFIFNWAHWLVGNSAHILAIVCIFLAVDLDKAAIPYWVNWLLVTYVAIHAFAHLVLSLAQCCYHADGSRKSSVMAMRDLAPHQTNHQNNHFYSTQSQADKKEDAHGSAFRKMVLAGYCILVASFSSAVIGIIVTGPWSKP